MSPDPALRKKTIALVGLMGVGKSSIGRRLAAALDLPFRDADDEIETAAGRSITEIFAERGEAEFREGERRVIARLLDDPPMVLATGGGAFVNAETRALIKEKAVSVRRVGRKDTRPLLKGRDPRAVLEALARERGPAYAEADLCVETGETPHSVALERVLTTLSQHMKKAPSE